jgi:hypothetical protein
MHASVSTRTAVAGLALVMAGGLVLAGCGTDGPSKEKYVAAGNTLCDRTKERVERAFPDFQSEPTVPQVRKLGADLSPVLSTWRGDLARLDPPKDLRDDHDALLASLEDAIAKLDAAAATDDGARALLEAGGPPLDDPGNKAHALFPRCQAGD